MRYKTLIVLVGGPCSGKSSIGKFVSKNMNINYISSGDIARKMAEHDNTVKHDLDSGKLAPESQMRQNISKYLYYYFMELDRNIVILDGFPRFGEQAVWLRNELPATIQIKYVLIHASLWLLKNRARNRGRSDDNNFYERYNYYRSVTYRDLHRYIDTTIVNDMMSITDCATVLENYIKEVTGC